MNAHHHDDDCQAESLHRLAVAAERIADTLDDYMEMSLTTLQAGTVTNADPRKVLDAVAAVGERIALRRADRR